MDDLFTGTGNRRRVYALQGYTIQYRVRGWYYRRTDHDEAWRGPYGSETSVCLMVAKQLKNELSRRDGLPA